MHDVVAHQICMLGNHSSDELAISTWVIHASIMQMIGKQSELDPYLQKIFGKNAPHHGLCGEK